MCHDLHNSGSVVKIILNDHGEVRLPSYTTSRQSVARSVCLPLARTFFITCLLQLPSYVPSASLADTLGGCCLWVDAGLSNSNLFPKMFLSHTVSCLDVLANVLAQEGHRRAFATPTYSLFDARRLSEQGSPDSNLIYGFQIRLYAETIKGF
ncbi:hypothetical protein BDW74DRAFT_87938 [Aspergillus multicolor]|uniref:uncharacterized protein n=1 Tax=Aspergillus multicolor TaxID=41759 RepID=UPI003CCE4FE9